MDWAQSYAEALASAAGEAVGWSEGDAATVLDLARLVAHGTERKNAPLATFLAGRFVTDRCRQGASASDALDEAVGVAQTLLVPPAETPDP